jgi:hypothetical protein
MRCRLAGHPRTAYHLLKAPKTSAVPGRFTRTVSALNSTPLSARLTTAVCKAQADMRFSTRALCLHMWLAVHHHKASLLRHPARTRLSRTVCAVIITFKRASSLSPTRREAQGRTLIRGNARRAPVQVAKGETWTAHHLVAAKCGTAATRGRTNHASASQRSPYDDAGFPPLGIS